MIKFCTEHDHQSQHRRGDRHGDNLQHYKQECQQQFRLLFVNNIIEIKLYMCANHFVNDYIHLIYYLNNMSIGTH